MKNDTKHTEREQIIRVADYPELSWKQIRHVLQKNGFEELKTDDKWYVHMQKGKKNIKIIKLNKIPKLFLQYVVDETKVPINYFIEQTKTV